MYFTGEDINAHTGEVKQLAVVARLQDDTNETDLLVIHAIISFPPLESGLDLVTCF